MKKFCVLNIITLVALAAAAVAQPIITDVVNAASRIPTGYPSAGIAQGSLFAIVGAGLGPDQLVEATFPLPTTDGLAGITVQINVGGALVNGIMVYAASGELGVILPSSTPTGTGTVTVNNNGAIVVAPITVVSNAFGAFPLAYALGFEGASPLPAAAFNVASDGSVALNSASQPGAPGQPMLLNGTGLGAIPSDETQSGAMDVPTVALHVFVGTQEAQLVSASRGTCCTGLPAGYPVPQGIAAWDVIQFIVPGGIVGCNVGVVVQSGKSFSNSVTIAVSQDGSPCTDDTAVDPGDTVTLSGTARTGNIVMSHIVNRIASGPLTLESTTENGTASFIQSTVPATVTMPVYQIGFGNAVGNLDPETCQLTMARSLAGSISPIPAPTGNPPTFLDAGPAINLTGSASMQPLQQGPSGTYDGSLGMLFSMVGVPPMGTLFLQPGTITADNGGGGADVASFMASLTLPDPAFSFDNIDQIASIVGSQGVTVQWSGGDPNGFVTITGTSNVAGSAPGSATLVASWSCSERISAGQFTVPPWITASMPIPQANAAGSSAGLSVSTYVANRVNIATLDLAMFASTVTIVRTVTLQ